MTSDSRSLSPRLLAVFAAVAILLVALIGWFGLVAPQHSKAKSLNGDIADAQAQLKVATLLARSQKASKGKSSGLTLLNTAMPGSLEMQSVLRQVQKLATQTDVDLTAFTPSTATPADGYSVVPISLSVAGRFHDLQTFLRRLRVQANSSGGKIHAEGRLFDVSNVSLTPSAIPLLTASIGLKTFVYTGVALAPPPTVTTESSTTEGT